MLTKEPAQIEKPRRVLPPSCKHCGNPGRIRRTITKRREGNIFFVVRYCYCNTDGCENEGQNVGKIVTME